MNHEAIIKAFTEEQLEAVSAWLAYEADFEDLYLPSYLWRHAFIAEQGVTE